MLSAYMIDGTYRRSADVWTYDFCDRFVMDPFLMAFAPPDDDDDSSRKAARVALRLHLGAVDALYAQALIAATGALEEF